MKNKKALIGIVAILLVLVVGVTIAYLMSSNSFENIFNTGTYRVVTTEVFESPTNWAPGEEIPKTITTTNEGTIPAAVRVSYTEQWLDENDNDITSQITNGTAIINLDNTNDWVQEGNYYYYKYILDPGDTTSSFIRSVTLNPNLNGVTCTASQDGLTRTCTSNNPASGATYKLTITKETVQADQYDSVWNTQVDINQRPLIEIVTPNRTKDTLQVGDEICINGDTIECFNFIGYDGNNVKMLAQWNLKVGDIYDIVWNKIGEYTSNDMGYGLQSSDVRGFVGNDSRLGVVAFSKTNYWNNVQSYPADIYDSLNYAGAPSNNNYSLAYFIEQYKDKLEDYEATVQEARLLTYAEAISNSIGCNVSQYSCPTTGNSAFITNTSFWLGSAYDNSSVYGVDIGGIFGVDLYGPDFYSDFGVRPVIVISKSEF